MGQLGVSRFVAEGYWPATRAGDGREIITQHVLNARSADEALSVAGSRQPRAVWYMAFPAEDLCDLRDEREREFCRARGVSYLGRDARMRL